jgi:hypothetical protein
MPGLIRHPVMALDSAKGCAIRLEKLLSVPGLRRDDKLKAFNCQVNINVREAPAHSAGASLTTTLRLIVFLFGNPQSRRHNGISAL